MIGFDFPIRPSWVHDVHYLWEPNLPISELVARALQSTMQELGGEKTRRNTLSNIIHYFVRYTGKSNFRKTLEQDAFVSYSRSLPTTTMESAYLCRIICLNDVARAITEYVAKHIPEGGELNSTDIRKFAAGTFGERKVVLNAASSYLRTLNEFELLENTGYRTFLRKSKRLSVEYPVFPLLVLSWSEAFATPQIDIQDFKQSSVFNFIETEEFDSHWRRFSGTLWSLETRLGVDQATLKFPATEKFDRELVALVN